MLETLATRFGTAAVLAIAGSLAWTSWLWNHDSKVQTKTLEKVTSASETYSRKADEKVKIVRKRAAVPGAVARLLVDSCRDCSGPASEAVRVRVAAPNDQPKRPAN